ncbi:MAG: hypothetical protein JST68_11175 [Bacteroidetes bacterium]|nr:hypothetical protein [Bacteroidota bacterium]
MKILNFLVTGSLLLFASTAGQAQPDTAKISQRALFFADSLVKVDFYENWGSYADLAPASVIKFYGGKNGYIEHIKTLRTRTTSDLAEDAPELKVLNLMTQEDKWQCIVRVSRYFHKGETAYHLVTSFVEQSKDEGETWKLFDVSYNKVANIYSMFPEIFGDMPIQEATIMTKEQEVAAQQKAAAEANAGKKAVASKKK